MVIAVPSVPTEGQGPAPALAWLQLGLSGQELVLQSQGGGDAQAPPARAILRPTHLLLPAPAQVYALGRCAVAHAAAHLRFSPAASPAGTLKPMSLAIVSAIEDARVERLMMQEFPGLRGWFVGALKVSLQPHALSCEALVSRMDLALAEASYVDDNHWVNKARKLFEAQAAVSLADYAAFRRIASLLANDLGQMRVPFRAELYRVPAAYRDDNSYLWRYDDQRAQPQAETEVSAAASAPPPPPLAPSNTSEQTQPAQDAEIARWLYPEWEHRTGVLRRDWCTVIDKHPAWRVQVDEVNAARLLRAGKPLRMVHARRLSRSHRLRRQWQGDDLDLNAAVDVMVAQRSGLPVDARLFISAASEQRACSVLVLLDMSESTNDRIAPGGSSLLDIEKKAALLLARALAGTPDRLAIFGFSSNTRAEVSNFRLLEFEGQMDDRTQAAIASAPGRHSTRIGAAVRHATQSLAAQGGANRILLLVTDGAPSDVDVPDVRYLVEDARHAVQEARRMGMTVHGLAVDPLADASPDAYVRRIFGWGHYSVVDDPNGLPSTLCHLYARLSAA